MTRKCILIVSIVTLVVFRVSEAAVTLWENHFDSGTPNISIPRTDQIQSSVVADPTNINNSVLRITDTGGATATTEWGEIRSLESSFVLADYGIIPGVDRATMSVDILIPSNTVLTSNDNVAFHLRYAIKSAPGTGEWTAISKTFALNNYSYDTWYTLLWEDSLVPLDGDGSGTANPPPIYIIPLISVADYTLSGAHNAAGVMLYMDNLSLVITPEPSKALLVLMGCGLLGIRRRR